MKCNIFMSFFLRCEICSLPLNETSGYASAGSSPLLFLGSKPGCDFVKYSIILVFYTHRISAINFE